jgi:hypothetical protein
VDLAVPRLKQTKSRSHQPVPSPLVCTLAGTVVNLGWVWLEYRATEADSALVSV